MYVIFISKVHVVTIFITPKVFGTYYIALIYITLKPKGPAAAEKHLE